MARSFKIWTWDYGVVTLDPDESPPKRLRFYLQKILRADLWDEFRKFPPEVVRRCLSDVEIPPFIRRYVEIWLEQLDEEQARQERRRRKGNDGRRRAPAHRGAA